MNSRNNPLPLYSTHKTLMFSNSKPMHRQGFEILNCQVSMPPSQQPAKLNLRGKLRQPPRLSQNGRRRHRPLHLIQRPKAKLNWQMHLNRQSTRLTKACHRPLFLSKQLSLLLKVIYRSWGHRRWTLIKKPSSFSLFKQLYSWRYPISRSRQPVRAQSKSY